MAENNNILRLLVIIISANKCLGSIEIYNVILRVNSIKYIGIIILNMATFIMRFFRILVKT